MAGGHGCVIEVGGVVLGDDEVALGEHAEGEVARDFLEAGEAVLEHGVEQQLTVAGGRDVLDGVRVNDAVVDEGMRLALGQHGVGVV